ncbi:MFS transporter [Paenibacillus antri]|uniref:MFS transporter n=1 Tax=Paenibacillus antri TaxID=2582848 RepID=A0A5R9GE89_9BACL|nr:MFS transporter [Paenibacillus antri]TLS53439.1 MFS transporter [Paenibacillus antri]
MDQKKTVRAWVLYDWANSAYSTTMVAAVLPIFFVSVPGAGVGDAAASYWAYSQSAAMLLLVILSPILGAVADVSGSKKKLLGAFMLLGVISTALYALVGEGMLWFAVVLTLLGVVGNSGANSFYDALLPGIVKPEDRDRVSAQGYAYGYLGGGLLLAVNLMMVQKPEWFGLDDLGGIRLAFLSVAVWWLVFSIPLFRRVPETKPTTSVPMGRSVGLAFRRLGTTLRSLRNYPELLKYLIAFWLFSDGIGTIIRMATLYGENIGIGTTHLITALLITQFVGFPCAILFGKLAGRFGAKSSLYAALCIYVVITILGYFMTTALHFYLLAVMVGFVQGGSQALARSIFTRLIPVGREAEYFGFMSVWNKFAGMMGPAVFGYVNMIGSSRLGILALIAFFVLGIAVLMFVDLDKGEREAARADGDVPPRDPALSL